MNSDIQKRNNRDMAILLIPVIAIVGKIIQLYVLPGKYFYDSNRMLGMMYGNGYMAAWEGYQTTVDIFKKINIFNLASFKSWSIALGFIGTIFLMILITKCKKMSTNEMIFTMMATGLLNIYVFTIAKEPVQFVFFLLAAIIIMLPFHNGLLKIIGCAGIFYWESNTYRTYYIMMALMCFALYFVFYLFRKVFRKVTVWKVLIATILCIGAMLAFMYLSQYVDHKAYTDALNVRETNGNENAVTAIINYYEINGNFNMFALNYVINAFRMMIPVELILKSPVYFPFFIYQIFILVYWIRTIKNIKNINERGLLSLICFTSYILGSIVFEPDFGSWVRHESASFPIFFIMAYKDLSMNDETKTEVEKEKESR